MNLGMGVNSRVQVYRNRSGHRLAYRFYGTWGILWVGPLHIMLNCPF